MATFTAQQLESATEALFEDPNASGDYTYAQMLSEDPRRAAVWRADAKRILEAAGFTLAEDPSPGPDRCTHHEPAQHRDSKPPWCNTCGEV